MFVDSIIDISYAKETGTEPGNNQALVLLSVNQRCTVLLIYPKMTKLENILKMLFKP